MLGEGKFATVNKCMDTKTEIVYAIKKMNKKDLSKKSLGNNLSAYDCVKEELKVLKTLDHPNVIWLHEIIDDPKRDHIYLVTEYHSAGSLGDKIKKLNQSKSFSYN